MTGNLIVKEAPCRGAKRNTFPRVFGGESQHLCVTAHCELVRMLKLEGPEPEQIAVDYLHAKFDRRQALLNFCSKLNSQTSKIASSDIDTLRTYGFTSSRSLRRSSW